MDGAAECQSSGGIRNIQLITHEVTNAAGSVEMSVEITLAEAARQDGDAEFRVGVRSDINQYRSNCFSPGGMLAGLIAGEWMLGRERMPIEGAAKPRQITLRLTGTPKDEQVVLQLTRQCRALG